MSFALRTSYLDRQIGYPANSSSAPVRLVSPSFHCSEVSLIAVFDCKYHIPNKLIALKINPHLRSTSNLSSWADCPGTSPELMSATRSTPQGGRFYHLFILSDHSGARSHHSISGMRKMPFMQSGIGQFGKIFQKF